MRISELRISNYKSFAPDSSDIKLSNITSIIGANSAGKTNLLEALDLFFHPTKLGAIYVAFGIPVYIIFDGDKPTPENYTKYQLINKIGKEKYFSFLNELNNCVCEKGSITAIQNKIKNVAPLLPLDLINELEKTEPNFEQIKLLLNSDYLLSKDKYNSIKNKENRNQKIQQYFAHWIDIAFAAINRDAADDNQPQVLLFDNVDDPAQLLRTAAQAADLKCDDRITSFCTLQQEL